MRNSKEMILRASFLFVLILMLPLAAFSTAGAKTASEAAPKGSVTEGEKVFKENCNMCHHPDKTDVKFGPGLKGLFKNKELPASHRPVTDANVREQIVKGNPNAKPMPMPSFKDKLKPRQIESLILYLKTL